MHGFQIQNRALHSKGSDTSKLAGGNMLLIYDTGALAMFVNICVINMIQYMSIIVNFIVS